MLKPQYVILLAALCISGGIATAQSNPQRVDAGAGAGSSSPQAWDGGTGEHKPATTAGQPRLLASLDGRAIAAAYAAIRELIVRAVKEDKRYAGICDASPTAMDVMISEAEDMYVMRIDRRVDRCGWAHPSFNAAFDPEFYAVSPDGKFLVRNPYNHAAPVVYTPIVIDGFRWPEETRLLAVLEGNAVYASYVAMQGFMTRFVREKKSSGDYNPSPKDVGVMVFELEDKYAIRIIPRAGTRGWVDPNLHVGLEPEVFVVSREGKLLGRFPDTLTVLLQPFERMNPARVGERRPSGARRDASAQAAQPATDEGIRWPQEMRPLAILDGPAIAASNAAMQHLQARLKKKYGEACLAPPSAMQVLVGREGELYFVQIEQHDRNCVSVTRDGYPGPDELVLYAVTPDGQLTWLDPD
jgi:hypothetical protein